MEMTSLPLITETSGTEVIEIGVRLENKMTEASAIHSDPVTSSIAIWGHSDQNDSLSSMESYPEVQRRGIGQSGNDGIRMDPPITIGGNGPWSTGRGIFNLL